MLISSGMEDNLRPEFQQDAAHSFPVTNVGDTESKLGTILMVNEAQAKEIESRFALIQADKPGRAVIQDLTTELRSD
jgi:hypothetical protein